MSTEKKARFFDRLYAEHRAKLDLVTRHGEWISSRAELCLLQDERLDDQLERLTQESTLLAGTIRMLDDEGRQLGKHMVKFAEFGAMLPLMKQGVEVGARIVACTATAAGIIQQMDALKLRIARRDALAALPAVNQLELEDALQNATRKMDAILEEYAASTSK